MCNCQCHTKEYGAPGTQNAKECCWAAHVSELSSKLDSAQRQLENSNSAIQAAQRISNEFKLERDVALLQNRELLEMIQELLAECTWELAYKTCDKAKALLEKHNMAPKKCDKCEFPAGHTEYHCGCERCQGKRVSEKRYDASPCPCKTNTVTTSGICALCGEKS